MDSTIFIPDIFGYLQAPQNPKSFSGKTLKAVKKISDRKFGEDTDT